MKNQSKGVLLMGLGWMIFSIVLGILYYMNAVAIWLSSSLNITGDAALGVQVIFLVIALLLLFSVFMLGFVSLILGVGYLKDITPFDLMERIYIKMLGDRFIDSDFRM